MWLMNFKLNFGRAFCLTSSWSKRGQIFQGWPPGWWRWMRRWSSYLEIRRRFSEFKLLPLHFSFRIPSLRSHLEQYANSLISNFIPFLMNLNLPVYLNSFSLRFMNKTSTYVVLFLKVKLRLYASDSVDLIHPNPINSLLFYSNKLVHWIVSLFYINFNIIISIFKLPTFTNFICICVYIHNVSSK